MDKIEIVIRSTQKPIKSTSDNYFITGLNAEAVFVSIDKKIEFVVLRSGFYLAGVVSVSSTVTYYPLKDVKIGEKISSVLMDLDGTTVNSENFWIEIIRLVVVRMINNEGFTFANSDIPFILGHSVSEHLNYCIERYCPSFDINEAIALYREISNYELEKIIVDGNYSAFEPTMGLKEF